jgi:hypothetical protein
MSYHYDVNIIPQFDHRWVTHMVDRDGRMRPHYIWREWVVYEDVNRNPVFGPLWWALRSNYAPNKLRTWGCASTAKEAMRSAEIMEFDRPVPIKDLDPEEEMT